MSVKVFRVGFDVNHYQSITVDGDDSFYASVSPMLEFNGTPKAEVWRPPPVYSPFPRLRRPAFGTSPWVEPRSFSVKAVEILHDVLIGAGELLPLPCGDEELTVLNVTMDVDSLDVANTTFNFGVPERYAFHAHRLPESTLFKIPQTDHAEVLCVEGMLPPEDGFKGIVEREGLEGVTFTELWDRDEGPREVVWDW